MRKTLGKKNTTKDVKAVRALGKYSDTIIACRVYNDADFVHNSTGNWLAVTFNSERRDAKAMHSTSSNTSRITVPLAGWYLVTGHVRFAANATGQRIAGIRYGGANYLALQSDNNPSGTNTTIISIATLYYFAASDYIELVVYQDSGGNLNIVSTAQYSPELAVVKIPFSDSVKVIG
jgi:hypothetical protein